MAILRSLRKLAQKTAAAAATTTIISNPTSFRSLISSNQPPLFSNPNNTLHGPLFLSYPPWKLLQSATPLYFQPDFVSIPNANFIKETKLQTVNLGLGLSKISSVKKKEEEGEGFESVGTRGLLDSFVNWPNFISIVRLVSGPVLGWMIMHDMYLPAFVGLAVSGATDWLDGYVARKMGINSVVGSYLDPLADKVLIGCVAMAMVERGLLHSGLVALVVLRDIALVGGAVYVRASHLGLESRSWLKFFDLDGIRPQKVEPLMISKVNTCLQLALVTFALLQPEFGTDETQSYITYLSWLVALTTVGSTAAYGKQHLKNRSIFIQKKVSCK